MESVTCVKKLTPYLRLFRIFGLFACSVREGNLVKNKTRGACVCYFWLSLILALVLYKFYRNVNKRSDIVTLSNICLIVEAVLNSVSMLTTLKQKQHINFFNKLEEYDEKLDLFATRKQESYRYFGISIALIACCLLARLVIDLLQIHGENAELSWHEYLRIIAATILLFILSCNAIKLNLQLFLLQQRFDRFNEIFSSKVSWTNESRFRTSITGYDIKELRTFLYEACETLNAMYNWPFFCISTQTVMIPLSSIYLEDMKHSDESNAWIMLLQLLSICTFCHLTASKANETGKIVMASRITLIDGHNIEERINLGIHLLHHRVRFSAAGCFEMNLQFYGNVITLLVTSYWLSDHPIW